MSALPDFAARSSTTLPSLACRRPRCVEVPKCRASKVSTVWFGSIAKVAGSAEAAATAPKSETARTVFIMEMSPLLN
jgi:hypothetical protein